MFRNKEIRWLGYGCLIVAILGAAAGFLIDRAAGMLVLGVTGGFGGLFFVFMRFRYRKIAELSELIDLVLHYGERVDIGEEEEGELSILRSEITKMTVRIREQNDALKREKKHLADSLADIAHQLRTPLTSANLVLTLMENDPDKGERKKLLWECEELFSQMDWLLTSLLKLSRLDAGIVEFNTEDVDVAGLVEEAVSPLLIPMELHDITLQKDVPADIRITGDAGWLSEAIKNILKNCMESAGDGGKIEIACEDTLLYTELTVKDNGAGFEPEQLHHIFDRFYRGKKENASGYGIGLALSKTIITRQNGTVTAKNHPAGGALFTIRFSK